MDIQKINKSLKRNIKNGDKYNKYFENVNCNSVFLGEGNTDFTLEVLRQWSKKYAYQTKELALKELKGISLQETVNNIHSFLYNHIQYEIDTFNQHQKSPACAWATRVDGMDCKSYSIFVSAILLNLKIKHFFKKVKQPYLSPENWTHVYVVIPENPKIVIPENPKTKHLGSYKIIDATKNPNTEVSFIKQKHLLMDVKLPHYGLNAGQLACACDKHIEFYDMGLGAANPTNETDVLNIAISRFHSYLDELEAKGMPKAVTDRAIKNLERFIKDGVEPQIADLFNVAEFKGLGIVPIVAAGGITTGATKGFAALIGGLIPKDFLNNTFGAVFANGFNLSCWNSTFTPAKVTKEVSEIHVPFFTKVLEKASSASSTQELEKHFNYLLQSVDISHTMYAKYLVNGANWRSCSKEAIDIYVNIVTGAKIQTDILLKRLTDKYNISIVTKTVPAQFTYPQAYTGQPDFSWSEKQHGNATYRVISFNNSIESTIQTITGEEGGEGDPKIPKQQNAGFGLFEGILLVGGIYGVWYASKQQKSK